MASGYEKKACGVDPDLGWGKPTRRDSWLTALYPVIVVAVLIGVVAASLWRRLELLDNALGRAWSR